MPVVPFIPLIGAGVQAAAARSSQTNTTPAGFINIGPDNAERLANKADKEAWAGLVAKYGSGQPVHVLDKASQVATGYGTADALGASGGADPRFSGAVQRGMASAQDVAAQGTNARTGLAMQDYALRGKLQSAAARNALQQAIDQMQMAQKLKNAQAMEQARANFQGATRGLASAAIGAFGNYLGSRVPSGPSSVPTTTLNQPNFAAGVGNGQNFQWRFNPDGTIGTSYPPYFSSSPFRFAY